MPLTTSALAPRLVLLLTAAAVFIIFAVAGAHFFRRPLHPPRAWFWAHQAGSITVGALHVATAAVAPVTAGIALAVAIALYGLALALFLWAQETVKKVPPFLAFAGVQPERLVVDGPYRFVRHPFYVSFIVALFAAPVATWNPWLMASSFVMTLSYVAAAFDEEAAFARTAFAARHRAYVHQTGMFVPRSTTRTPPVLGHDLSVLVIAATLFAIGLAVTMLWELLGP